MRILLHFRLMYRRVRVRMVMTGVGWWVANAYATLTGTARRGLYNYHPALMAPRPSQNKDKQLVRLLQRIGASLRRVELVGTSTCFFGLWSHLNAISIFPVR